MKSRWIALTGLLHLALLIALGCSAAGEGSARITATPTKTPRPLFTATATPSLTPTATPIPPTDMPLLTALPTETPPPTDVPLATETSVPTDMPMPTDTSVPTDMPPTQAPKPAATQTPPPPTHTPKPQVDFRVADIVAFEDGSLGASGLHNIYFTVLDAAGGPIDGVILEEVNNQPALQVVSGDKGPGKAEFTMWATDYRFKVLGNTGGQAFTSETTHVLSLLFGHAVWDDLIRGGICADPASCEALGPIHFSYNVTFQRTW